MNSADKFITVFKSIIVGFWMIGLVGTWEKKLGWLILKGKKKHLYFDIIIRNMQHN